MKYLLELKPCPLCGSTPKPVELYREDGLGYLFYRGKISCRCGLSFEKEWVETLGDSVKIPNQNTTNVFDEWNDLMEKMKKGQ